MNAKLGPVVLTDGTRLGPYRIVAPLGAGGMGEVYRAIDTRLARDVAIKILPPEFAEHPVRLQRFELEARAAGMLNHPNVLTIFDIGNEGALYLVFELLEGETLRERLSYGHISTRKAIEYALQIANGLAAAHQKGIIHRDLKPENVFITRDGRVKILDFGLARVAESVNNDDTTAPIPTTPATNPGQILGTASYMAPEQVRGELADPRSDIFALGAILYEALAGRRAFTRDIAVETLNAILNDEPPDLMQLDPATSPAVARVVRHCLEKNPDLRWQAARDLAFQLESLLDLSSGSSSPALSVPPTRSRWPRIAIPMFTVLASAIAGAGLNWWLLYEPALDPPTPRYLSDSGTDHAPATSPDGQTIAYASLRDGTSRIWLKQLRIGNEVALTSGPDDAPRFSPDGSMILFTRAGRKGGSLYRVSTVGGEPLKIVDIAEEGDWSPDGQRITFIRFSREGVQPVSEIWTAGIDGSDARRIHRTSESILAWPRWSPDGRWIAATAGGRQTIGSILLVGSNGKESRTINPSGRAGVLTSVAWLGGTKIVYGYSEALTAARSGPGAVVVHDIDRGVVRKVLALPRTGSVVDVAGDGHLVLDINSSYQNLREIPLGNGEGGVNGARWLTQGTTTDRQPAYWPAGDWVIFSSNRNGNLDLWKVSQRDGTLRRITDHAAEDWDPAFSPNGTMLIWSSNRDGHFEIWGADIDGSNPRRISSDGTDAENGTATRDGEWIIYTSLSATKRGLWKVHPDGTGATQLVRGPVLHPEVSPDGQFVVYHYTAPQQGVALEVVRAADGSRTAFRALIPQGMSAGRARWMPDGRAVAFVGSDTEGRNGVFVQDFDPANDTSTSIRKVAGFDPELPTESFGVSPDGKWMTLSVVQRLSGLMSVEGVPEITRAEQ